MNTITGRSFFARTVLMIIGILLFATIAHADDAPETRIVGGQVADPGEWPWQVMLVRRGSSPYEGWSCGGSLINQNWVLTAAHCVDTATSTSLDIVAGIHNRRNPDPNIVRVAVNRIVVHPGWDKDTYNNDAALLRLASPIPARPASANTLPIAHIPLVPPGIGALTGVMATVTGWGNTIAQPNPGGINYPDRLHEVEVPIISNADCNSAYGGGGITAGMMCAGYMAGGKDSCQGDSGGPLVIYNENSDRWQLAGIVSWGNGCAAPNYPGVYARVSTYISWINSVINPATTSYKAFLPAQMKIPVAPPPPPPQQLRNGDFEQGAVVWTEYSQNGWDLIVERTSLPSGLEPHSGDWLAWLGGDDDEISYIEQTVTVPQGSPHLAYHFIIASRDACGYDISGVVVNGTPVRTYELCNNNNTDNWVHHSVNLSAFAGQAVKLQFRVETDSSLNSNWFLDDVAFVGQPVANDPGSAGWPAYPTVTDPAAAKPLPAAAAPDSPAQGKAEILR